MKHLFWGSYFVKVIFWSWTTKFVPILVIFTSSWLSFWWKGGNAVLSLSLYAKCLYRSWGLWRFKQKETEDRTMNYFLQIDLLSVRK